MNSFQSRDIIFLIAHIADLCGGEGLFFHDLTDCSGFFLAAAVKVIGGKTFAEHLYDGGGFAGNESGLQPQTFEVPESIKVTVGGKVCEWGKLDEWKCYAYYTHGGKHYNPFVPKEVWDKNENGDLALFQGNVKADETQILKIYSALEKYFPTWVGYNMAKCGGCIRACVSMLEKKGGCMCGRFKEPLRTGKPWKMER